MEPTFANFMAIYYGVGFGSYVILFVIITLINKNTNWYLLESILGIEWVSNEPKRSDECAKCGQNLNVVVKKLEDQTEGNADSGTDITKYLYINFEEKKSGTKPLPCYIRLLSDLLVSAILAVFFAILFSQVILAAAIYYTGDDCPKYDAYCFGFNGSNNYGPFNCSQNQKLNFSANAHHYWCIGWVYKTVEATDVLGSLGTCGGLLGIVASIVPLTYSLSRYKKRWWWISLICFIIPLLPVGGLAIAIYLQSSHGLSELASIVFGVVISMVFIGWFWALRRSYKSREKKDSCKWLSRFLDPECCRKQKFCSRYIGCQDLCCKDHNHYPCCWIRCEYCDDESQQNDQSQSPPLPTQPVTTNQPTRSAKHSSNQVIPFQSSEGSPHHVHTIEIKED